VPEQPLVDTAPLTEAAAEEYVAERAFSTGTPGFVGTEVERLLRWREGPTRPVTPATVRAVLEGASAFPRHGRLTFEPGGALEVSSPPSPGPDVLKKPGLLLGERIPVNPLVVHVQCEDDRARRCRVANGAAAVAEPLDPPLERVHAPVLVADPAPLGA